jgi:uncharacterized protein
MRSSLKNGKEKMQLLKEETYLQQTKLAAYCRTGLVPEGLTGVKADTLPHYRRLVFNVVQDILESAYPITHSYLKNEVWKELIFNFFSEHKCQSAQVWRMPLEFYDYCIESGKAQALNIPFLNDLLYFEWLELDVHTMEDIEYPKLQLCGDWLKDRIALNPEHRLLKLIYPVHSAAPGPDLEDKAGEYFLLMYREKESGNVQLVELSVFYVYLLENIKTGSDLESILADANVLFAINDMQLLLKKSQEFVEDMKQRKFIVGFLV